LIGLAADGRVAQYLGRLATPLSQQR
jgi:hypothetical protein